MKEIKEIKKCINKIYEKNKNSSKYFNFGLKIFGPLLFGFSNWLKQEVKEKNIKKLYFLSRDGFMMKKAFDLVKDESVITEYVYFSRKSIRQALIHETKNYKDSLKYLSPERFISIGEVLEYYGFNNAEQKEISNEYNINLKKEILFSELDSNVELNHLYNNLRDKIVKKSKEQDELLIQYINQIGLVDGAGIVDIGWHGSMQFYLEKFMKMKKMHLYLNGFYLGNNLRYDLKGKTFAYLYNDDDKKLRKDVLCFFGGYEKLFQSCEGSTFGYCKENERIRPILGEYEYKDEKEFINNIFEWQKASLIFVNEAKNEYSKIVSKSWAYPIIKFGKYPSNVDVELFKNFYNTDGGNKVYYVSQKNLFQYNLKEFIYALSNSVWKTGFLKSVFKLPLPYYFIYRVVRK